MVSTEDAGGWLRRLTYWVMRHRRHVYLSLLGAVVGGICQTIVPLAEREIVDRVSADRSAGVGPWLWVMAAVAVIGFAMAYLRRYHGGRVALGVQYDLRNAMHEHLQRMDARTLEGMPTGQLVGRANSDSGLVQGLLNFFPLMSSNVLLVLLSLSVMLVLAPVLALVALVTLPALAWLSYRMRNRVFPASWDAQQHEGDVVQLVDEGLNGVRVVKAFGQEQRELQRVSESAQKLYGAEMRVVRLQSRFQPVLQVVPPLGQVGILALGGWMAMHDQVSLGTFLAFSTYMAQLVAPAQRLSNIVVVAQQARAGLERIFQLLDLPPSIADRPDAVDLTDVRGQIELKDVGFGYADRAPVLDGFSLSVAPGERVALVGPSGCGKSTVLLLLARFYDVQAGSVRVDGRDVREVTLGSLRGSIGTAFEESFLFSASVRDNIAYSRPDARPEQIEAAARAAGAHEFIAKLPQGYETVVGERGLSLSGGQRQRVALARALLYDPAVLVLDDATSAVDSTTEEAIHASLREVMRGRTTLLVAHRRSTLHLADRIVVMDAGRVLDQGSHDELMQRCELYRRLLGGMEGDAGAVPEIGASATTASAWAGVSGGARTGSRAGSGGPNLGMGLAGGGKGLMAHLTPTPKMMAQVEKLPPLRDFVKVDLAVDAQPDPRFSLVRLLLEFKRPLFIGLLLVVLDALATLAGPILVKHGVDNGIRAGSTAVLFATVGLYLALTVADLVDQIGQTFVTGRAAQRVMLFLRVRIWAQLQRLSMDYYEREMAGQIMTRMTTDVDQFESLVQNGALAAVVSLVTFVGIGITLLVLNLELGLLTLVVVLPLAVATVLFRRRANVVYNQARDLISMVNASFQEGVAGIREAQAFGHTEVTVRSFNRLNGDYLESRSGAQRLVALYFPFSQFLAGVAGVIVLGVGAGMIRDGRLTPGALIAFVLYIDLFFSPIQQLSQVFDAWQQTTISVSRIGELMRTRTLTPNTTEPAPLGDVSGQVDLESVYFAYPKREPRAHRRRGPQDARLIATAPDLPPPEALRGIDLRFVPGETVALVGETGAGKSTLVKLLARFYDVNSGRVALDGHDLRDLDIHAFRSHLGYVPQESFLFTGTVRDNIAYGRPDATDAEVEAAARAVGAHDFVAALTGGYLHVLAERGRSLSAGQRQLLALARAQLVDPALLLLDEATSNLDLITEARVNAAMERVAHGRTTVVIAHRLQTARSADRIVVLHGGQIAEIGGHDELVAADGRYAAMWKAFEVRV